MSSKHDDPQTVIQEFRDAVNMTPKELESWLKTDESKEVGQKLKEGAESIGHQSGESIVELLHKGKTDYNDDDLSQMKRVVSYVHRHMAQRPGGNIENSRWRHSLMNWGHDPLK
ncbi:DUF3140 domain-containing protein [Leptolyngbya sp. FACHB-261]|uniref:DUF3140 domain-containing protein n=1 Tax=Leptolyngbya sp. FACHB-261 TaxID=2692806 RepID=UPI001684CDF7|nr:DUF3140 domain-containing protein [Leptolyngbya sp. FACHB-261]MBD2103173.1 DUF3140 domain-containing protein [Leptolyngbya sp. FACHB-261]